jgi:hypothetical protein
MLLSSGSRTSRPDLYFYILLCILMDICRRREAITNVDDHRRRDTAIGLAQSRHERPGRSGRPCESWFAIELGPAGCSGAWADGAPHPNRLAPDEAHPRSTMGRS